MNYLERVEKLRERLRLTVGEVQDLLNMSPAMMSMIRGGSRSPSIKAKRRLEEAERAAGIEHKAQNPHPLKVAEQKETEVDFPVVGKLASEFSNHWKKTEGHFQSLEKRQAAVEKQLDQISRQLAEVLKKM